MNSLIPHGGAAVVLLDGKRYSWKCVRGSSGESIARLLDRRYFPQHSGTVRVESRDFARYEDATGWCATFEKSPLATGGFDPTPSEAK